MNFDPQKYMINENLCLREYQLKSVEILKYFSEFCDKHNLTYYICGGTCLGALRHQGFVPWDCDIDVFMHRSDYEKIEEIWNKNADTEHYAYDRTSEYYNMHAQTAAIKDNYTTYIRIHNQDCDMNHGLAIDIVPLDALSDNFFIRQWQKICGLAFCIFNAQRVPNQQNVFVKLMSKVILGLFPSSHIRYKIWKFAEGQISKQDLNDCKFVGELTTGFNTINMRFPKDWFGEGRKIKFEDLIVKAPSEAEKYTFARYGEYEGYPPVSEQVPKMRPAFVDMHTPYKQYKGIRYCFDKLNER